MKKLEKILDRIYDFGKLPKGITPYLAGELYAIYKSLSIGRTYPYLSPEIHSILKKCGIKTVKTDNGLDIGWVAVPKIRKGRVND